MRFLYRYYWWLRRGFSLTEAWRIAGMVTSWEYYEVQKRLGRGL